MRVTKRKIKIIVYLTISIIAIAFVVSFFIKNVRSVYETASLSQVKSYIYDSINITTDRIVIDNRNNSLVETTKDEKGLVSTVTIDTEKVNILSNEVAVKCQEDLKTVDQSLVLHWGAFTGFKTLAEKGRTLNIPMRVNYTVKSDFKPYAEQIGINVVRYALYLKITTQAEIVLPVTKENAEFVTYILVSESVFACDLPETFISGENGMNYLDLLP